MKQIIPFRKDIVLKTNIAEVTSISIEHDVKLDDKSNCYGEFIISGTYKMTDVSINNEPFSYDIPFDIILDDDYIMASVNVDINDFYYEIVNDNILRINIELAVVGNKKEKKVEEVKIEEFKVKDITEFENNDDRDDINITDEVNACDEEVKIEAMEVEENVEDECAVPLDYTDINEEIVDVSVPKKEVVEKHVIEKEEKNMENASNKEAYKSNISIFDSLPDDDDNFSTYNVHLVQEGQTLESILTDCNCTLEEASKYNDLESFGIGYKIIVPTCDETN